MRLRKTHKPRDRGQALIEFALLFPVIAVIAFIIFDMGVALDRRIVIQHAVADGARHGAVNPDIQGTIDYTEAQSQGLLNNADTEPDPKKRAGTVSVCYMDDDGDGKYGEVGDSIKVQADFDYYVSMPTGGLLSVFNVSFGSIKLNPSSTVRLEKSASVTLADQCT